MISKPTLQPKQKVFAALGAVCAGCFLAMLIQLNAGLAKEIGVLESSFMAHFVGALLSFVFVAVRFKKIDLVKMKSAPWYLYMGGVLGVGVTVAANIVVPHLGVLVYSSLLIAIDFLFSTLADHLGLFGLPRFRITPRRFAGLLLAIVGVNLIFWF